MRVDSFKVSNYRSIDSAEVELANLTCLVGPNNEGKSNLLRALGLGLYALLDSEPRLYRSGSRRRYGGFRPRIEAITFDARLDRPAHKSSRSLPTVTIRLVFDDLECSEFHKAIGHTLNGELSAQIQFGARGPSIQYKKQRVGSLLTEKADVIGEFLRERLMFQYVPPIRTANDAAAVIVSLVQRRLAQLQQDSEYAAAAEVIDRKNRDALEAVQADLQDVLKRFLPGVRSAQLQTGRGPHAGIGVEIDSIMIDDGVATELDTKGSGVQSLAALALMRHRGSSESRGATSVLALEEPEAHLHSGAMHQLRPLLAEIAEEQQLVFTTHSGILVPTSLSASRVVVRSNKAETSRSMAEVRAALGVRLADNLTSARLVLVVEGRYDIDFWQNALSADLSSISLLMREGSIGIEQLMGTGNLSYQLQSLRRAACDAYVVLDGDKSGRSRIAQATNDGSLAERDYLLVTLDAFDEAEVEDLLDPVWVDDVLGRWAGERLDLKPDRRKWASRLKSALKATGKDSSDGAVGRGKSAIWDAFKAEVEPPLSSAGEEFVGRVALQLENRLHAEAGT